MTYCLTDVDRARRVVAGAYVRRTINPEGVSMVERIESAEAELRGAVDALDARHSTWTGRSVLGKAITLSLLALGVVLVLYRFGPGPRGAVTRQEFMKGYWAGKHAAYTSRDRLK